MPPLRRSENSESDSSLPDFAAASSSDSESEGEEAAAASLEAALRRLTPRMPPLRRSASSASDSSLPDLASASSSASEAESEGSFNLPRLARGQAGSAAFWAGVDNWRRESGITEPRSPGEEGEIMHAMSELAVNVLAASRREGDREVARTIADRLYYNAVQAARENGEPLPPPPPWLLREWRRRRDTFLLCRRRRNGHSGRHGVLSGSDPWILIWHGHLKEMSWGGSGSGGASRLYGGRSPIHECTLERACG